MESSKAVILAASVESIFLNDLFAGTAMNLPGCGSGPGTAGDNDKSEESNPDLGSEIITFWLVIFAIQLIVEKQSKFEEFDWVGKRKGNWEKMKRVREKWDRGRRKGEGVNL